MAVNINIDNIATDLNNKADKDLTNSVGALSSSAKEYFSGLGMPSDKYVDLTLGANGTTYTAPANGWYWIGGLTDNVTANTRVVMRRTSDRFGTAFGSNGATTTGGWVGGNLAVKKGDVIAIFTVNPTADIKMRFYYAESEV